MVFQVLIHESEYGFDAYCPALPGCVSQGETSEEALDNIKSAIQEYLGTVEIVDVLPSFNTQP